MAKKLNKKIVVLLLVILGIGALGVGGLGFYYLRERNPEHCLHKAEQAMEKNDYKTAERYFGRACGVAKTNQEKINNYFRFAVFQLIQNEYHEADWAKALGCWSQVLKIDPKNQEATQKLFDYFYEIADLGQTQFWKQVQEYSENLLEIQKDKNLTENPKILLAHGRAALEIARSGGTTNRQELLDQAVANFQKYIDSMPADETGYRYLAQCALVHGDLEISKGNLQAREAALSQADQYLLQATENAENKSAAWANRMDFQLRTLRDPNQIGSIRKQLEDLTKTFPANAKLYTVLSTAYERSGTQRRSSEITGAIEAMRQAIALDPENVPYTLRLATLLYYKGSIQMDEANLDEALQVAEEALTLRDAQEKSGPRLFYARSNQYALLSLIAQINIERILEARRTGESSAETTRRLERTKSASDKIAQILGTRESPAVQKWQGLITLAEGQNEKAIRQLYKAYEQAKAHDLPGEASQIDPMLCYTLAQEMADRNVFGMQREFLEKALSNQSGIANWKPRALVEYANLLLTARNYPQAVLIIRTYENAYGTTPETEQIRLRAYIEAGFLQEAEDAIAALDPAKPETLQLQLHVTNKKITEIWMRLSAEDSTQISEEEKAKLVPLYDEQFNLLSKLLAIDSTQVDQGLLISVCQRWIQDDQAEKARELVSTYLRSKSAELPFLILQKQLEQPDPKSIPAEQLHALTKEAIELLPDLKLRAFSLAKYYQSIGQIPESLASYREAYEQAPDDPLIASAYYELLLSQEDFAAAEKIARQAREKNLDGCEGSFFYAQMEIARKEYPTALRRLDECLSYRPMFPQAWLLKSRAYFIQNDLQAALNAAQSATRMNPLSPDIVLNYASLLHERNLRLGNKVTAEQTEEAERFLLLALVLNPGNRNLQSFYAEIIYDKDPEKALAMRQQLLRREPSVSNAVLLGNMAMRMAQAESNSAKQEGLFQVAGQAYQQALAMAPANEGILNAYSEYLRLTGQTNQAEKMLGAQPDILWKFYLRDGQYDKAEKALKTLRNQNPENQDLLRGLILVAHGKGDRTAMRHYLDTLLPLSKTEEDELWVLQRYLEFEFTESVEDQIASFRERHPENTHVLLLDAWFQMSSGQLRKALSLVNQFLETRTEHAGGWRLRGRIYRLMGDYPKAIESLLRSRTIEPAPVTRIELANVYMENSQIEAAIGELQAGLSEPQAPMQIRSMLENIYEKHNRVNNLRKFYQETLEKYPDSVYWYFRAGKFLFDQKELMQAESMLFKAWQLSREQGPGDPRTMDYYLETLLQSKSYNKLLAFAAENIDSPFAAILYTYTAQTHLELGQKEKAAQNFFKALDKTGTNLDLMNGIISIILEKTGPDLVVQWCQQKFSQDPKSLEGLLTAINLYTQLGQYNQALQYMDTCLAILEPRQVEWILLSLKKANLYIMAYAQTTNEEYLNKSIILMEEIIEIMPQNYTAMNNLAYLLADNNQQLDKALQYARKACQNELGNPVFLDTYAYIQCLLGNYNDAHQSLLRTIQLHEARNESVPWEVYKHIGMAQQGLGKIPEAVQAYQRSIETSGIPAKEKEQLEKKIQDLLQS